MKDETNYGGQNYDKREQSKTGQVSVEPRLGSIGSNRNRSWRKLRSSINFYHRDKEKKRLSLWFKIILSSELAQASRNHEVPW